MALLTAEDILNKAFETVRFSEGYNIDQVDDFLDEVVKTVNTLQAENDDLRAKLAASEQRVAELARAQAAAPASAPTQVVAPPVNQAELDDLQAKLAAATQQVAQLAAVNNSLQRKVSDTDQANQQLQAQLAQAAAQPAAAAPAAAAPAAAPVAAAPTSDTDKAAGLIALAQKLHDEYVRSGQEEGDRIVAKAKEEAAQIVGDANDKSNRILTQLEQEKSLLERKIEELRIFERDYRTRLKSYLQNLLDDLDQRGAAIPARPDPSSVQI